MEAYLYELLTQTNIKEIRLTTIRDKESVMMNIRITVSFITQKKSDYSKHTGNQPDDVSRDLNS